ncbi:hypothetical protein [Sphingomonas sp. PB4P5]|uniref:hypothetical protein n=1 Tax=Parasphingomonas puruogangriensis TaxID=3096155 RepID=UPI002FC8DAFA
MTALSMVLTNAGRAAMVNAITGGTNAVRIVSAGLSASVITAAPTLTALPGEFKRVASVAGKASDNRTVHLVIRDSSADAYTTRAIGLYLEDGTLFAVYAQPTAILGKAEVSTFLLVADLRFLAGEAALVQFGDTNFLNPPASETEMGVAYLSTLAEALAGLVADKTITPAVLKAVLDNYVTAARLGVPSGVATLGPDGKLLVSQRPPIDLIDVWPVANQAQMLALAATVGDFAVRADSGLIYVLQSMPATTLANWLEISTPAPVSSVNGKVGAAVLNAGDVGAVPIARQLGTSGLITGGGPLSADRALTVPAATRAQAEAGLLGNVALTPDSIAGILAMLGAKVPLYRVISGSGLVTGGGDLQGDVALNVPVASAAEIMAGLENGKAITPAALAGLAKSLTPNGYYSLPGGLIVQWIQYRSVMTYEAAPSFSWPTVFPNGPLAGSVSGWLPAPSLNRNMWPQLVAPDRFGCQIQLQRDSGNDVRLDGFDIIMLGY